MLTPPWAAVEWDNDASIPHSPRAQWVGFGAIPFDGMVRISKGEIARTFVANDIEACRPRVLGIAGCCSTWNSTHAIQPSLLGLFDKSE